MLNEEKARKEIEEILNRREYKLYESTEPNFFQKLWMKLKEWIIEQIEKLFPSVEQTEGLADMIMMLVIFALVAALLILSIYFTRKYGRKKKSKQHPPLQHLHEMEWTSDMHLEEVKKCELRGDYSAATRHLFLAILLLFHEKDYLEAKIWKTNWEYYEDLRKENKQWAEQFQNIAFAFDDVTYGYKEMEVDEYKKLQAITNQWLEKLT